MLVAIKIPAEITENSIRLSSDFKKESLLFLSKNLTMIDVFLTIIFLINFLEKMKITKTKSDKIKFESAISRKTILFPRTICSYILLNVSM